MKVKYWLRDYLRELKKEQLFKDRESKRGMVWTAFCIFSKHETACWPAGGLLVCWGPLRTNHDCSPARHLQMERLISEPLLSFASFPPSFHLSCLSQRDSYLIMKVKPISFKHAFNVYFISWKQKVNTLANNQHDISVRKVLKQY